jgi:hypothetical protein
MKEGCQAYGVLQSRAVRLSDCKHALSFKEKEKVYLKVLQSSAGVQLPPKLGGPGMRLPA